jgi:hypothetical protein
MPTSGETDWVITAGDLVTSAMRELGVIAAGMEPEDTEMTEALRRLIGLLSTWAGESNLWRESLAEITITGGTGAATLPTDVRDVMTARHIVSATYKRQLGKWNRDQFYSLPNRTTAGNPTIFYYSQQTGGDVLRIWPVPAANITLEIDYGRAPYVVTAPEEELDLPQEWFEAALYGLAARCANMFGATKLDSANVQRVTAQAATWYQKLLDRDRPDSYFFESDSLCGGC